MGPPLYKRVSPSVAQDCTTVIVKKKLIQEHKERINFILNLIRAIRKELKGLAVEQTSEITKNVAITNKKRS